MRNFNRKGYCTIEELKEIISECEEVVMLANDINKRNFKTYIELRNLKLNYNHGEYEINISYNIKKRDDNKETTFNGTT